MVQNSKGGNKKRSVKAGKKVRLEMKHNRKNNYKKKVVKKVECCVCMEEIPNTSDNTITCGKVNHVLCGECKMKCEDCPMCRSHKVQKPKSQNISIRVNHRKYTKIIGREKIGINGLIVENVDLGNGIYEKLDEDMDGFGVYKHEYRDLYIYRDFDNIWVLDDKYDPSSNYVYAEGKGKKKKLTGKNTWLLSGSEDWVPTTIRIKKLK
tara:strand:+ start:107 stop:730 length:624 start_codon:yes stop_codon:yes gene_type:complete